MALVMVLGLGLGWYARSVNVQRNALTAIRRAGGNVAYDWDWGTANPDIINPRGKPRAPKWLADRIGIDYVANIAHVSLVPNRRSGKPKADDETMAYVGQLLHLESLWLNGTAISDAGLAHIKGLTKLRDLTIGCPLVTNAGLVHLEGMTQLGTLYLAGSKVTDDGVLKLQTALPRLQIIREEDLDLYKLFPDATNDLLFAQSQSLRVTCKLLENRAMVMIFRRDKAELIATIDALCNLQPADTLSLERLAAVCSQCIGMLDASRTPFLSAKERQSLQDRCQDRGVAALTQAIAQGYDNVRRLDGDMREAHLFWNLRTHRDFPALVTTLHTRHPDRSANK